MAKIRLGLSFELEEIGIIKKLCKKYSMNKRQLILYSINNLMQTNLDSLSRREKNMLEAEILRIEDKDFKARTKIKLRPFQIIDYLIRNAKRMTKEDLFEEIDLAIIQVRNLGYVEGVHKLEQMKRLVEESFANFKERSINVTMEKDSLKRVYLFFEEPIKPPKHISKTTNR